MKFKSFAKKTLLLYSSKNSSNSASSNPSLSLSSTNQWAATNKASASSEESINVDRGWMGCGRDIFIVSNLGMQGNWGSSPINKRGIKRNSKEFIENEEEKNIGAVF